MPEYTAQQLRNAVVITLLAGLGIGFIAGVTAEKRDRLSCPTPDKVVTSIQSGNDLTCYYLRGGARGRTLRAERGEPARASG